ncbi:hypothetical protein Hanom_Chr07g00645391 [Helianthus anomalus]
MSGGGLFLQTPNHPLKGYFVLLWWTPPSAEPGPVDYCKPPSEPALPEKSGGHGGLDVDGCFCWLASRCPVVPRGVDRLIGSDDNAVARMVEAR